VAAPQTLTHLRLNEFLAYYNLQNNFASFSGLTTFNFRWPSASPITSYINPQFLQTLPYLTTLSSISNDLCRLSCFTTALRYFALLSQSFLSRTAGNVITTTQETGSRPPLKYLNCKAGRLGAPDRPGYPRWNPQAAMCKWSGLPNPKSSCKVLKFHTHHGPTPSERTERKPSKNFAEHTTSRLYFELHGHSRTSRRRFFNDPTAQNNITLLRRQL
jgi:hypothetical protein